MTAHCYLVDAGPMSSTAKVLEQWVVLEMGRVLLVVVGARGRTRTAQGHVATTREWVIERVKCSTGLVPGVAGYPSSTFVGTERMVVVVVEKGGVTCLSVDRSAVESEVGVGSDRGWSKRWDGGQEGRRERQTPVEGVIEVVGDGRDLVSSLDEIEVVVVDVESRWRRLMVMVVVDVGGDGERDGNRVVVVKASVTGIVDALRSLDDEGLDDLEETALVV